MKNYGVILIGAILIIYLLLDMIIPGGGLVLYPIKLFVTFLHEFGHALGAIITGGDVKSLQVNADGSGVTWSAEGNRAITIIGGYLGSAIFGNLLLYIGIKKPNWSKMTLIAIAILMNACSLVWYSSAFNLMFTIAFSVGLLIISRIPNISRYVLMFLGGVSVLHIISDFNVGPSSDLNSYAEVMGLTNTIWMYIWLVAVLAMTYFTVKQIIKRNEG